MSQHATAASYTSSVTVMVLGGLSLSEWALIVGIVMAFFTAVVNWHYKRQHLAIAKSVAEATIAAENAHSRIKRTGSTPGEVLYQLGDSDG